MRIVAQTRTHLALKQHLLGVWILAGFTFLIGLLIFVVYKFPSDLFGQCCIATAALIKALTPIETCIFDKDRQQVVLSRKHWLGEKKCRYEIAHISRVQLDRLVYVGTVFYRVSLRLTSGHCLNLTRFPTTDRQQQMFLAETIHRFIRSV